ncbi:MAG TPA: DUF1565 domain-containing protein, partial [bacterium]|nr:DUF1565 domain-containing protein [bacterium]
MTVKNSVITDNGEGVWIWSDLTLENCILWGNTRDYTINDGELTIRYSVVEDGYAGEGNISDDPHFIDPDHGDYRIRKISPCIDAGNPSDPVPPNGGDCIDMGYWEYPHSAVLVPESVTFTELTGDQDGDLETGETIEMAVQVRNTGEPGAGIGCELTCTSSAVSIDISHAEYGTLGYDQTATGCFRWRITGDPGICTPVEFTCAWTGADAGSGEFPVGLSLGGSRVVSDAVNGDDLTGDGSAVYPFGTMDHGVRHVRGTRWYPVTVHAQPGDYREDTNGERFPIMLGSYETLEGSGYEQTRVEHNQDVNSLIQGDVESNIQDLGLLSDAEEIYGLIKFIGGSGRISGCHIKYIVHDDYYLGIQLSAECDMVIEDNVIEANLNSPFRMRADLLVRNNTIAEAELYMGHFIGNHVGPGFLEARSLEGQPPTRVEKNVFVDSGVSGNNYFEIIDN